MQFHSCLLTIRSLFLASSLLVAPGLIQAEVKPSSDTKNAVAADAKKIEKAGGLVKQVVGKSQTICIQSPKGQMIFTFSKDTKFNNAISYKDIQPNQKIVVSYIKSGETMIATEVSRVFVQLPEGIKKVSTEEMKELITKITPESGVIIFDTRPPARYHQAHIPGSLSLPSSEGKNEENDSKLVAGLPKDKSRPIIFYCGGPTRGFSAHAAALALKNGYLDIRVYYDGYPEWQQAELAFASSPKFVKDENIILIDLRPYKAYEAGHIPGAINIPAEKFSQLPENALPDFKDAPVVFYGDDFAKINAAVEQMRDSHFSKATYFPGGVERWKKLGNQLATGSKPVPEKLVYIRKLAPYEISIADFKKNIGNKNVMIIDARTKDEFALGAISGAINIPCDDMPKRHSEVPRGKPVYLYCANGARSDIAYEYLKDKGYTNIRLLKATVIFVNNGFTITD